MQWAGLLKKEIEAAPAEFQFKQYWFQREKLKFFIVQSGH